MTVKLEKLIRDLNQLSTEEQDAIATLIQEELAREKSVRNDKEKLITLAEETLTEYRSGKTKKDGKEIERIKAINHYFSLLTPLQKESVIGLIKSFLKTDERISTEKYNEELNAAENRIAKGQYTTQEAVERLSKKW